MASLHRFKLLASQCAVAGSPTQSPTTSPVIHLRRRKTLRMLLSRTSDHHQRRRRVPPRLENDQADLQKDPPEKKRVRRKLKDLFVSSPPFEDKQKENSGPNDELELLSVNNSASESGGGGTGGLASRRVGAGSLRPVSGTFRYRLLRRAWRPMLLTIPE